MVWLIHMNVKNRKECKGWEAVQIVDDWEWESEPGTWPIGVIMLFNHGSTVL